MVLMGFYITDPYHIGPESYSSHSILISVACPLEISLSPVKHCVHTQTNLTETIKGLSAFPFSSSFFLFAPIHRLSSLIVLFSNTKRSEPLKCVNIQSFSPSCLFVFFFLHINCVVSSGISCGVSHSSQLAGFLSQYCSSKWI